MGYDARSLRARSWLGPLSAGSRLNWDFLAKKMWHHFWAEDSSVGLQLQDVHRFFFFGLWMFMDVYGVYDFDTSQLDGVSK